jgi:hypothetical protein
MKNFWNPNTITKIATSLVVGATVAFNAVPEAKAEITRGTIGGYQATVFQSGSYSAPDYIEIVGPRGKETISVTCAPYDWKSTGPNTAAWVGSIASQWCNS